MKSTSFSGRQRLTKLKVMDFIAREYRNPESSIHDLILLRRNQPRIESMELKRVNMNGLNKEY
jgi:hypothetical protein